MSAINGKKLTHATLHNPIFVEDIGSIGSSLHAAHNGLHKAVDMTIDEPFVILRIKDRAGNEKVVPVPITGFTHMVLAKE